ncbi:MAG: HEAT repeat domain-containing protein [Planctomycetota bacterium]|nr:HEAT repeat domain-containing protein [Planctomycetota bacterium]
MGSRLTPSAFRRTLFVSLAAVAVVAASCVFFLARHRPAAGSVPGTPKLYTPAIPAEPERAPLPAPRDAALAPLLDRDAKLTDRVKPDVNSGIPKVIHPEDYPLLVAVLTDPTDDDTARNEVANLLQRSKYPGLADALCEVLDNSEEKPRFRSYAAQHLGLLAGKQEPQMNTDERRLGDMGTGGLGDGETGRGGDADRGRRGDAEMITARLRQALSDRDVPVRREALLALVRKKDPQAIETAVAWLQPQTRNQKPETVVVDLAIRCVYELGLREHIPTIRKYARDPNDVVRIAAIVALSQWGDEESRPAFEEAAQSKTVRLQRAGKAALERLGKPAPQPGTAGN